MKPFISIDIVSDVVCPWCIIGYRRLMVALDDMKDQLDYQIQWHPFELNPNMPLEGQNLRQHVQQKYGVTEEQSRGARANLTQAGLDVGFQFNYFDEMKMYNTFAAHQLLHWAAQHGKQTELKLAFFDAFFTNRKNVSDQEQLIEIAESIGLNGKEAKQHLEAGTFADEVRAAQSYWQRLGVSAVPAVILDQKYLISGAQEPAYFKQALTQLLAEAKSPENAIH